MARIYLRRNALRLFTDATRSGYREGMRVTVLLGDGGYAFLKRELPLEVAEDAAGIALLLAGLAVFVAVGLVPEARRWLFKPARVPSLYVQNYRYRVRTLPAAEFDADALLEQLRRGTLVCFGFAVSGGFCEYSYGSPARARASLFGNGADAVACWYERVCAGNDEVTATYATAAEAAAVVAARYAAFFGASSPGAAPADTARDGSTGAP